MTDNEIIKGAECCTSTYCLSCPYDDNGCLMALHKDTINLINRQKAEIERLKKDNEQFADIGKMYSEIKAEAVKEFAVRLCEGCLSNDPVVIAVKVELEMAGENNGNM